jgi:hypothetical protein
MTMTTTIVQKVSALTAASLPKAVGARVMRMG